MEAGTYTSLEAELAKIEVAPRPNSRNINHVHRHAETSDLDIDELDFDYDLDSTHYPLGELRSWQKVFDVVQHKTHLTNDRNFSDTTMIECFELNESHGGTVSTRLIFSKSTILTR